MSRLRECRHPTGACKCNDRGKSRHSSIWDRGLVFASLNINSLLSHIDKLGVFISSSKVGVLVVNESKLDSAVHNDDAYLTGFELVGKDRKIHERNGGGVCIYLRTNLNYRIREDLRCEWQEFFISMLGRAFKITRNGVYFVFIALSVPELLKILIYAN